MKDIDTFQFHKPTGDQNENDHHQWTDVLSRTPPDGSELAYEYELVDVIITGHRVTDTEASSDTSDGSPWDGFLFG